MSTPRAASTPCVTCGRRRRVEWHHVGGRRNADITVPACTDCHHVLSAWQRDAAVPLRGTTTPVERAYAVAVDALNVPRLMAERSGQRQAADKLARIVAVLPVLAGLPAPRPALLGVEVEPITPEEGTLLERFTLLFGAVAAVWRLGPYSPFAELVEQADPLRVWGVLAGPSTWPGRLDDAHGALCEAIAYAARHVARPHSPAAALLSLVVVAGLTFDAAAVLGELLAGCTNES